MELLDAKEAVVEVLPGGGGDGKDGFKDDDVTQQYAQVTLPDNECVNCSVRGDVPKKLTFLADMSAKVFRPSPN